jgi:hypothetical protein
VYSLSFGGGRGGEEVDLHIQERMDLNIDQVKHKGALALKVLRILG